MIDFSAAFHGTLEVQYGMDCPPARATAMLGSYGYHGVIDLLEFTKQEIVR